MPRELMKAVVYEKYGSPAVQFTEVERPVPTDDQVLIRIRASSVNGPDRESVFGRVPYGSQPPPGSTLSAWEAVEPLANGYSDRREEQS